MRTHGISIELQRSGTQINGGHGPEDYSGSKKIDTLCCSRTIWSSVSKDVGQHISSRYWDEGIVLPKLSLVCQTLGSGFSNANSAHEKAGGCHDGGGRTKSWK